MPESLSFANQLAASTERLFELIDRFSQARVLVVGDLTRHETTRQTPGGGANAAYNLAQLSAKVKVVGLVGKDGRGEALRSILEETGMDTSGIIIDPDRPTVTKTLIAGHSRQSVTQQIVRVDRKSDALPNSDIQLQLVERIRQELDTVDAIVCSDYGDGVFTTPVIEAVLEHSRTI